MALNLFDGNWLRKSEFKQEYQLGESTYQTRIKKMTNTPEFMKGYAKVNAREPWINKKNYEAWLSSEAEKNIFWINY